MALTGGAIAADRDNYPIMAGGDEDGIVAYRAQRPVRRREFLAEVAALAARLPDHHYVLNLCGDRYRFLAGFAAALQRGQISLLPSSDAPAVLSALARQYPDLYVLQDTARPAPGCFQYPLDLCCGESVPPAALPGEKPAVILFTSGSSGQPKPVAKSWGTLVHSAAAAGRRLGIAQLRGATLIGTVPHQHSYGLESLVMLALQHGLSVDAGTYLYPADIRAALERATRPRILVTTPVHIRALLADPVGMPGVDLILSATAPLPPGLAAAAEACFGATLIEIYGCTEAGQIATRRTARETQWHCLDEVDLSHDARGSWASGPAVPARTLLHDVIEPTGPGRFTLGDRSTDLVDVAGKRTSLAYLNHQLLGIPGVADGVFVMGDASGERVPRLMAFVVAPKLQPDDVLRTLRDRIDAVFLPRPLVFVAELPRNALGKLPRAALLQLAAAGPDA